MNPGSLLETIVKNIRVKNAKQIFEITSSIFNPINHLIEIITYVNKDDFICKNC
jgi:hypothetical protein